MSENDYCLWILMRNDMLSLNPGKAMAQAAHAANQFVQHCNLSLGSAESYEACKTWQKQSGMGFGVTIVLAASLIDIQNTFYDLYYRSGLPLICSMVTDSSYPIKDGETTHLLPVVTCAYIFGKREDVKTYTDKFSLYP